MENNNKVTSLIEYQIADDLKRIDFSVVAWTGVELILNKINPFLEYVYTRGITDNWKKEIINESNFWKYSKNVGMLIKGGIKISI